MSENRKFTLRNQEEEITQFTNADIVEFLNLLYEDDDEFVVISADEPVENISFLQAVVIDGEVLHTEIGVITQGKPRPTMYECNMTAEEGEKLFFDFAKGIWSGDMSKYSLCEFQP